MNQPPGTWRQHIDRRGVGRFPCRTWHPGSLSGVVDKLSAASVPSPLPVSQTRIVFHILFPIKSK